MSQQTGDRQPGRLGRTGLTACLLAMAGAVVSSADVHTLSGVVVSKADGRPLAGVTVTMAHAEEGYIHIGLNAEIWSYGPQEKVLFFFPKRNGRTVCEAQTDEAGRFTLKNFTSLTDSYTIVAGSAEAGLAMLTGVRPRDYADKPLRIEIDRPAYVTVRDVPRIADSELDAHVGLRLAGGGRGGAAAAGGSRRTGNVALSIHIASEVLPEVKRLGPLIPGQTYRLSHAVWGRRLATSATLFETVVKAEAGKTLSISLEREGGVTLSGRIATKDGRPLRDVNVMVRSDGDSPLVLGALTDAKGEYTIRNVPTGKYKLELLRYVVRVGPG